MIASRLSYFGLLRALAHSGVRTILRRSPLSGADTLAQMAAIGLGAVPTACLIAVTAGFVLALVLEVQLGQIGKVELVPSLLWVILTEQVVPTGVALIFAGRSVSAVTAELGSMQVSEEIKALHTMGIEVVPHLLLPRFLSFLIMAPAVTLLGVYASLFGGWLLCWLVLGMGLSDYVFYALDGARFSSVLLAVCKGALFGFAIAVVAIHEGMNVRNGAREISEATTRAVVVAVIVVTLANAAVTALELT